jgi:hypothetical protein
VSALVAMSLDDYDPVAMTMPSAMPATVTPVFGTRAITMMVSIVIATALDHDGLGARNRRRRDRDRTECCDDISKLLHVVLLTLREDQTSPEKERSDGTAREF